MVGISTDHKLPDDEQRELLEKCQEANRELAGLARLTDVALSTLVLEELMHTVLRRLVEVMDADTAVILLREGDVVRVRASIGIREELYRGFAVPISEGFAGTIAATERPLYIEDAQASSFVRSPYLRQRGVRSMIGVPLRASTGLVGVLHVDWLQIRPVSDRELHLLQVAAGRIAPAIANAILYDEVLKSREQIAHEVSLLQRALLPSEPRIGHGYQVSAVYIPGAAGAEIGGDFYDVFRTERNRIGLLIGDVSGKGIEAASTAAVARSTVHAFGYDLPTAGDALSHSNLVIYPQQEVGAFITVFFAVLDPTTGATQYAIAGHPPPAVYRAADGRVDFFPIGNPPVGLIDGYEYQTLQCYLDPGDKLVMYTDGISEARRDNELFGTEGVERVLTAHGGRPSDEIVRQLVDAARAWANGHLTDDVAVVVVEREKEAEA